MMVRDTQKSLRGIPEVRKELIANILSAMASDYFQYLASVFPVMCASDEFHFMPRAMSAAGYYDQLDSLSPEEIKACISALKL